MNKDVEKRLRRLGIDRENVLRVYNVLPFDRNLLYFTCIFVIFFCSMLLLIAVLIFVLGIIALMGKAAGSWMLVTSPVGIMAAIVFTFGMYYLLKSSIATTLVRTKDGFLVFLAPIRSEIMAIPEIKSINTINYPYGTFVHEIGFRTANKIFRTCGGGEGLYEFVYDLKALNKDVTINIA